MPREPIPAKSDVLRWARHVRGYNRQDAARELGITDDQLAAIERGAPPTSAIFGKMLRVYAQTESILLLPSPPETDPLPHDYRAVGRAPSSPTPETLMAIREARRVQHFVGDLLEEEPEFIRHAQFSPAAASSDAEAVAEAERARFGVTPETQRSWGSHAVAFREWRSRMLDLGILVLLKSMPWEDCRGVSLGDQGLVPMVVVNSEDKDAARNFTLFHEYAHFLLGEPATCLQAHDPTPQGQIEDWCSRFAAAFLVPAEDLRGLVQRRFPALQAADWKLGHITRVASDYHVSRLAMARRLKELGITPFYDANRLQLYQFDHRSKRPQKEAGGPSLTVVRLSEIGIDTALLVLDAVRGRLADAAEAARAIGLSVDQLGDLETRARQGRGASR